ncbi:hypothetical protein LOTGIDRAFT_112298 [Lottia gigantea]|uniref:Uncharacterized protein n=1 Tax=Lottia gigantea TaxID=225164 RepID=V4A9H9_LOTGI|nr:hypothetical protein LOTGIDRAFT_112298 [Lottia gigantea]ESP00649.1 hypothetical protein LOTGIDRAFT_112298 [Lottia gigantea]
MRDSSYQDNFDQSQSRSRDSANRNSYLSENQMENLETSQHSNYSKQSVRDSRYGNSRQNIPDSFYSNNSDNRHGNPNMSRNSSYNTDKYNTVQNNSNPERSRSRTGNPDQSNRLSKGDNFQSPDYAVPDR